MSLAQSRGPGGADRRDAHVPTPSRVLPGKRKIGQAIGHGLKDCWNYTTEIAAILKDKPDAGGWAVASMLKSNYSISIAYNTVGRWLDEHC